MNKNVQINFNAYNILRQAELHLLSPILNLDEETKNSLEIITLSNFALLFEKVGFELLASKYQNLIIQSGEITNKLKWMLKYSKAEP
jgi:hypothetical protein